MHGLGTVKGKDEIFQKNASASLGIALAIVRQLSETLSLSDRGRFPPRNTPLDLRGRKRLAAFTFVDQERVRLVFLNRWARSMRSLFAAARQDGMVCPWSH